MHHHEARSSAVRRGPHGPHGLRSLAQLARNLAAWAQTDPSPPASPPTRTRRDRGPARGRRGHHRRVPLERRRGRAGPPRRDRASGSLRFGPRAIFEPIRADTIPGGGSLLISAAPPWRSWSWTPTSNPRATRLAAMSRARHCEELHEALARRALLLKSGAAPARPDRNRSCDVRLSACSPWSGAGHHRLLAWMRPRRSPAPDGSRSATIRRARSPLDRRRVAAQDRQSTSSASYSSAFGPCSCSTASRRPSGGACRRDGSCRDTLESFRPASASVPGVVAAGTRGDHRIASCRSPPRSSSASSAGTCILGDAPGQRARRAALGQRVDLVVHRS